MTKVLAGAAAAALLTFSSGAIAAIGTTTPTIQASTNGTLTVTLANGDVVTISPTLAAQISTAMAAGDADAVAAAIKALILANAPNDADMATAILLAARASTTDATLQAAAQTGVDEGNPGATSEVAANITASSSGVPGAGGNGGGGTPSNVPSGGTSGGGTGAVPSGN